MRLLYITAEVPYPLTSGYLRHFHFLHELGKRHHISYMTLSRRGELSPEVIDALGPSVTRLEAFPIARGGGPAQRALARRKAARRLAAAVREHLETEQFDAVLLSGKDTFSALAAIRGVPVVIDVCDATSLRLRGEAAVAPLRRRLIVRLRLAEIRAVERRLVAATSHLLFASERDRAALMGSHGGEVVRNAVDLDYWTRRAAVPEAPRIVFSGVMSYGANHDAALRLVERVMPFVRAVVPGAEAVLAGRDPRPELVASSAEQPGVTVTGACDDLRPHVEAAAVYCAPLRFASGIQNKLLEALAMEVPVVTTSVAAEGLRIDGAEPPVVIADDDQAVAAAVVRLLRDPGERARLAAAGRRYVEMHCSWKRSGLALEAALTRAARGEQHVGTALAPEFAGGAPVSAGVFGQTVVAGGRAGLRPSK